MDVQQLEAFVAVADHQSFSKAANALFVSQPAISKRIITLEKKLGVKLFERIGQQITLSKSGAALLIDARSILEKYDDLLNHSQDQQQRVSGNLRVATSHHIGLYRLPNVLKEFVQHYPDVKLNIHFTDSEIAYQEVLNGQSDLAIATLPNRSNPMITTKEFWQDDLVLMLSKKHPLAKESNIKLSQLKDYPAIFPGKETFTRKIIDSIFERENLNYHIRFNTNYLETIKVMVETGIGWSILPKIMANDHILPIEFKEISNNPNPQRKLGCIIHKNKHISPTIESFLKIIEDQANN